MKKSLILFLLVITPLYSWAEKEFLVAQKGKAFQMRSLTINAGDKVTFRNDDPYSHNVFSLDGPFEFDLGSFEQGDAGAVTFTKTGRYEIECAIHPEMKMSITVKP